MRRRIRGDIHRIIPSRHPPVNVFDHVRDAAELNDVFEVEALTNNRLREELGILHQVAPEDRRVGDGWGPVMAAFCHPNTDGSRFSDGSYGIYYGGLSENTAILESVHGRERFLRQSAHQPAGVFEMRRYVNRVAQTLDLLPTARRRTLLDPDDYGASRAFGARLRTSGAWGIYYSSVRDAGGHCIAALRPPAVTPAAQASHYKYHWDGTVISHVEPTGPAYRVVRYSTTKRL